MPVFGYAWDNKEDPGKAGLKLGEEFSYEINVHRNVMYLTFHSERHGTIRQARSLIQGADEKDNPYALGADSLYFKAGVYNQCSTKSGGDNWYAACAGTGDWETEKANGDYAQATFSRIELSDSTALQSR